MCRCQGSKVIGTHPDIKYHFYADDTQLFIHISHKNAALAFNKLNSCLLDVQKWMSSSMLKLNPDKTEFIIFGSHAQLKKLDPYLPVKIFGNFMHPMMQQGFIFQNSTCPWIKCIK